MHPGSNSGTEGGPIATLMRGLHVLSRVAAARDVIGVSELAQRSELDKATTHRLASKLVELGYLERDGGGKFRLSLHVLVDSHEYAMKSVIKRLRFPLEVMLVCVRWYVAYPLSLRDLEEMMQGARRDGRSLHDSSLDPQADAGAGKDVSKTQGHRRQELADGRDVYQGLRPMKVSVSRGR
jgi:hypothetical protein